MIAPAMIHNAAPAAAAYTELFFLRMEGSITEPMHRTDSAINIGDLNTSQTVPGWRKARANGPSSISANSTTPSPVLSFHSTTIRTHPKAAKTAAHATDAMIGLEDSFPEEGVVFMAFSQFAHGSR